MDLLTFFKEYYNVEDDMVASNIDELNEETVIYNGDLLLANEGFINLPNLKVIIGNAYLNNLVTAIGIDKLEYIIGNAYFCKLRYSDGLENLKVISEDASFDLLKDAKSFKNMNAIGGIAYFGKLKKTAYIENIDMGTAYVPKLKNKHNN